MGFKINFDEKNVSSFGLIEEGKYEVAIINAELKNWNGQYSIGFDVEIRTDIPQNHQGAKILYNTLYLTSSNPQFVEDTEKKRNAFFKACGYSGQQEIDVEAAVSEIIGKSVLAYVKHETKNDKTFAKVKFVAPSNADPVQQDSYSSNKGPVEVSEDDLPF